LFFSPSLVVADHSPDSLIKSAHDFHSNQSTPNYQERGWTKSAVAAMGNATFAAHWFASHHQW
jgi:hypothetical protein